MSGAWRAALLLGLLGGCGGDSICTGRTEAECREGDRCMVVTAKRCVEPDVSEDAYGGCMLKQACSDAGYPAEFDGECLDYTSSCIPYDAVGVCNNDCNSDFYEYYD